MSDAVELAEREALLADLERQIAAQRRAIDTLRDAGHPTQRASLAMAELHMKADRQRDYLRVIRERLVVVPD